MVDLGQKLKDLRKARGLTQLQVAERVGISKAMVSSYELSTRQPSYDILIRLALLFGVSTDHLLGIDRKQTLDVSGLTETQIHLLEQLTQELRGQSR